MAGGRAGVFLSITAENGDRLISVSAPGTALAAKITGGSVNLPAQVPVDLTGPVPKVVLVALANPLQGGETVTLNLTFAEAGTVTMRRAGRAAGLRVLDVLPAAYPVAAAGQEEGEPVGQRVRARFRVGDTDSHGDSVAAAPSFGP